jgi:hypothetical protein
MEAFVRIEIVQTIDDVLDNIWREFCRDSGDLLRQECKRFEIGCLEEDIPLHNVSSSQQAIDDRLGGAASASVDRLFDKSVCRLFTDLLQIGRRQEFEPRWAYDQTLRTVRRALNQIPEIFPSSRYKDLFVKMLEQTLDEKLEPLLNRESIEAAKRSKATVPSDDWDIEVLFPNSKLRRAVAEIVLKNRGKKLKAKEVAAKLEKREDCDKLLEEFDETLALTGFTQLFEKRSSAAYKIPKQHFYGLLSTVRRILNAHSPLFEQTPRNQI